MLEKLIEMFLKFPGIGPRQAKRFAFFLAAADNEYVEELSEAVLRIKGNVFRCPSCFRFFEAKQEGVCGICSDINRDKTLLMVVEKDVDMETIEKSEVYDGLYFVLGGVIPMNPKYGEASGNLKFKELFNKVHEEKPREIIMATSATFEGENTARYAKKILEPLRKVQGEPFKITRLGKGLSTGTEMEYIDSETMSNALKNRK